MRTPTPMNEARAEARVFVGLVQRKQISLDDARKCIQYENADRVIAEQLFEKETIDTRFQFRHRVGYEFEIFLKRAKI